MMFRSKKVAGLALAVASVTALAACSSGGSSGGGGNNNNGSSSVVKVPGGIGSIPMAAAGRQEEGRDDHLGDGARSHPELDLPGDPLGQQLGLQRLQLHLPGAGGRCTGQVNGVVPEIEQNMSLANVPQYSNGNKTLTITMKSNYKWSNGKPITADDLLFTIDVIKAAIKASPANWAGYTPKHFPDNLVSTSEPNSDDPGAEPERRRSTRPGSPRTSSAR